MADTGGSGLKQVELRRANIDGTDLDPSWAQIGPAEPLNGNGPTDGVFYDTPPGLGNYWYGLYVTDNANNSVTERQAGKGPKEVTVATATATPTRTINAPSQTPTRTQTPQPPNVTTNAATDVGQTSATLNTTVSPNGSDATVYFDYGETMAYGVEVLIGVAPGDGAPSYGFGLGITGLTCGSTYHFRAWATNSGGRTDGDDQSFITSACGTPTATPNVSEISEPATLTLTDGISGDQLGWSVGLSSDGSTVLLGAPSKVVNGNSLQGAAYVFVRSGTTWTKQAGLTANDGVAGDLLGTAAALSSDGNTARP